MSRLVHNALAHLGKIALSLMVVAMMVPSAQAAQLLLAREVVVKDDVTGAAMLPNAVVRAGDGGYLIAGQINATQQAWAMKVDAQGGVLWRYQTGVRERLPIGQGAEFYGVAAMPDGSSFFCGNMPRGPGKGQPGLLTHLDPQGHVISEELIVPKETPGPSVSRFSDCIRWGDGVAILGDILRFPAKGRREYLYWLMALTPSGERRWEKMIATTFDSIDGAGGLLVTENGGLVFRGGRVNEGTELFAVNFTGQIEAQSKLPGQFAFSRPVVPDGTLQLNGYPSSTDPFTTIVLNDRFEEQSRIQARRRLDFAPYITYRMPNGALVLFGSKIHTIGERYTSGVLWLDATRTIERSLDLTREPFYDSGFARAAVPTGRTGEFFAARNLIELSPGNNHPVGAALDFVKLN